MLKIAFFLFILSLCWFTWIMTSEPRTLLSGVSFSWMMVCLALSLFFLLSQYAEWLSSHDILIGMIVVLLILALVSVFAFPALLVLTFFIEGIRIIRREGMKPSNLLSMLFAVLLCLYLTVWPAVGGLVKNALSTKIYAAVSLSAFYLLTFLAVYTLSAMLNLIHLRKRRNADYIIVLGAGLIGKRVTPLLASRIEKGIDLLRHNPNATIIMSGGQGPGEDIAEGEAMAAYAVEKGVPPNRIIVERKSRSTEENLQFSMALTGKAKPRIIIVTTAYHVFRALLLAKQQGIKCVGFGSKTKWYFALNAFIREFIGYLYLTRKQHILTAILFAGIAAAVT